MHIFILILRWAAQALVVATGIAGVLRAHGEEKDGKRSLTRTGKISVATILTGFLVFAVTDLNQRNEISELHRVNERLTRMSRDRAFEGFEVSFTPSAEQWSQIEAAFEKTARFVPEIPNSAATMRAEPIEDGEYWKFSFDEVNHPAGLVRFPRLSASDPRGLPFQEVIKQASPSLWIKWGPNLETDIEPMGKLYASAMIVSRSTIGLSLRSPVLKMKLNELTGEMTILVRSNTKPATIRFRSLDDQVTIDQVVNMQWREETANPQDTREVYLRRTKPYISGPHKLQVTFKT